MMAFIAELSCVFWVVVYFGWQYCFILLMHIFCQVRFGIIGQDHL